MLIGQDPGEQAWFDVAAAYDRYVDPGGGEFVPVEELVRCAEILARAIAHFCSDMRGHDS